MAVHCRYSELLMSYIKESRRSDTLIYTDVCMISRLILYHNLNILFRTNPNSGSMFPMYPSGLSSFHFHDTLFSDLVDCTGKTYHYKSTGRST